MTYIVKLVDGAELEVTATDAHEAVLAAGDRCGQDIGHLVLDVEPA